MTPATRGAADVRAGPGPRARPVSRRCRVGSGAGLGAGAPRGGWDPCKPGGQPEWKSPEDYSKLVKLFFFFFPLLSFFFSPPQHFFSCTLKPKRLQWLFRHPHCITTPPPFPKRRGGAPATTLCSITTCKSCRGALGLHRAWLLIPRKLAGQSVPGTLKEPFGFPFAESRRS